MIKVLQPCFILSCTFTLCLSCACWGGADCARGVKLLCAAQKLLAGIFSNFMTFPDFYSSQSWFNF